MNSSAAFVVDDDSAIRRSMQGLLELMGRNVRLFDSAEAFLQAYDSAWSGHLFVDLQMPGLNGLELLEDLPRRKTRLRMVLITGHGSHESEQQALKTGACAVLNKPFSAEHLEDVLPSDQP